MLMHSHSVLLSILCGSYSEGSVLLIGGSQLEIKVQ